MQVNIALLSEAISNERIDSQFFRQEYVNSYEAVCGGTYSVLSEIAHITDGNHLKIAENFDDENGIRYLRGQDLSTDMMLHDRNIVHIPEYCYKTLKRSHIFQNDILITIVGANTGLIGLVFDPPKKLVANCKLGIARPNLKKILPGFLYAFLISRYGQHQILRSIRGGGQTGLILPDIRQLRISRLDSTFESEINRIVLAGHKGLADSKNVYRKTQDIVLSELGMSNWQPKKQLTFIRNFSDFKQSGRFDAEYFQPKYEEINKAIQNYSGGWDTLANLCELVGHPSNPPYADTEEKDKTFIVTQKHLGDFSLYDEFWEDAEALYTTEEFTNKNTQYILKFGDVLLYSVGAYIGKSNIYTESIKATIGSFLTLIRTKNDKLNPFYLMAFLNTDIGIAISKQHQRGMAQQYLYPYDIRTFPIPIFPKSKQVEIQQTIIASLDLRKQSKQLIEFAKRAVEIAIEQDEDKAIKWLQLHENKNKTEPGV